MHQTSPRTTTTARGPALASVALALAVTALVAPGCSHDSFPTTPTPLATAPVVLQGTRYQGSLTLPSGTATSFNMTLIARGLSNPAEAPGLSTVRLARGLAGPAETKLTVRADSSLTVTGNFETGNGLTGTVQGTLVGSLDDGVFNGSLTTETAGHTDEQQYTGPLTSSSAALTPGPCLRGNCMADGLAGSVQATPTTSGAPPPPSCPYTLSPATASVAAGGGTGAITITTSPGCAWSVMSTVSWMSISGSNTGTGTATVTYSVQPNNGEPRTGSLRAAGQTTSVTQASAATSPSQPTPTPTPTQPTAPTITEQPEGGAIRPGGTTTLSVAATGSVPLSYQWYAGQSGATTDPIPGATASTYNASPRTTTSFWVRVTNNVGHADSGTATVVVNDERAPVIVTQPQNATISPGSNVTLSVEAVSETGPLTYQWFAGSSGSTTNPISGATSTTYTTPALTSTTSYWVRVTNPVGSSNSNTATVSIGVGVEAPRIASQPENQTVASGAAATLRVAATGTAPLSYQWYQGSSGAMTSPIPGATAGSFTTSSLTSTTSYWVRVSNAAGSVNSNTATVTVTTLAPPPTITSQPQSQTINSGARVTLSVAASGAAPINYQWYQGQSGSTTTPIAGATATTFTTPALSTTTSYWVRVANSAGSANSVTATITVNPNRPASLTFSFSSNPVQQDPTPNAACSGFPRTWTYNLTITNVSGGEPYTVTSWTFNFPGQVLNFTAQQFQDFFRLASPTIPSGGRVTGTLCVGSTSTSTSVSHTFNGTGGSFTSPTAQLAAAPVINSSGIGQGPSGSLDESRNRTQERTSGNGAATR